MPAVRRQPASYRQFDPLHQVSLSLHYLTNMVDPNLGCLPYGCVQPWSATPCADHLRADDAVNAALWLEGISCAREILETDQGADVEDALRTLLLAPDRWDEATGLRFPAPRPWSGPEGEWIALCECGPVLSALARIIEKNPDDSLAKARAAGMVAGLRSLTIRHEALYAPGGILTVEPPTYSFPADIVVRGRGLVPELASGYADANLRIWSLIDPIMRYQQLTGDEVALDLATGLGNFATTVSHPFGCKSEFFGDVHAALTTAIGLARLGRVLSRDIYVARAKALYDFVRRQSSSFGWVPDFMRWQLPGDVRGDASCTAALLVCALELISCNFPEYWDDANKLWRNQLAQLQIEDVSFVPDPPSGAKLESSGRRTYDRIRERLPGACCGASSPAFVFLGTQRLVSARASAEVPRAHLSAWRVSIEDTRDLVTVNFPIDRDAKSVKVRVGYPNSPIMRVKMLRTCRLNLRVFPWMNLPFEGTQDGRPIGIERREDHMLYPKLKKGVTVEFHHDMAQKHVLENVNSLDFYGIWRGPDMVDLLPHSTGPGYRLYQTNAEAPREPVPLPTTPPEDPVEPLGEPAVSRETRLNRRKAPRS